MRKTTLLIGTLDTKGSEHILPMKPQSSQRNPLSSPKEFPLKEINEKIIPCGLEVHSALEPGLLEIKVNRLLLLTFKFFKFYEESPPPSPSRGRVRVGEILHRKSRIRTLVVRETLCALKFNFLKIDNFSGFSVVVF